MLDNQIIDLYIERNEQAVEATAEKYGAFCNQVAYNILADINDSEECVNDTYIKAWETVPHARPSIFSAFLAKITRSNAIDRYKGTHSQKRGDNLAESIDELYSSIDDSNSWSRIELSELASLISKFLRAQNEATRRIFVLRYFYEYSIEDIAHIYNTMAAYIKIKLYFTRAALAKYLESQGISI